jgi:hypothetical protein
MMRMLGFDVAGSVVAAVELVVVHAVLGLEP